jgi:hemin uptake protein HemP
MIMDVNSGDKRLGDAHRRRPDGAETHPAWIDSRSIFGDRNEVVIRHGDQIYRLRVTKLGKLILNK